MRKLTKRELAVRPSWATHYTHHFGILTPDAVTFYGDGKSVYCYGDGNLDEIKTNTPMDYRAVMIE